MLGTILGAIGKGAELFLSNKQANDQADLQKKFAQKGIQWKVADAEKAGIHPLYALGANTVAYNPVSVGVPDLGSMGQDIGQAIDRVSNPGEKAGGALGALALERAGLENDLLRAQIARARLNVAGQAAMGPLMMGGTQVPADPGTSDAADFEQRYGDSSSIVTGPAVAYNDLKHSMKNMSFWDILKLIDRKTSMVNGGSSSIAGSAPYSTHWLKGDRR